MRFKYFIIFPVFVFLVNTGFCQGVCNVLGQNPGTAFPVCGTDTFSIASVAICGDREVPGPCNAIPLTDKNPYWYKFTCFSAGTLGFLITPNTITDDYDWQIFDITNHRPEDVYTDASLFVACNWSGHTGLTGTNSTATSVSECDSDVPIFSKMPNLVEGHQYLLLVSHFSDSQSGYALSFSGGTANITDPVIPALDRARAACDGSKILVRINKKMKCASLDPDGSDFTITPAIAPITGAIGIGCTNGFDMDSIVVTLGGILPPGNYTIGIRNGADGNNLLDNCNRGIPDGQSLPVTVYPVVPTPMDSMTVIGCAPDVLELVFRDPMFCSSIAADGSDFVLSGPSTVSVTGAEGVCSADGFSYVVRVRLSAPLQQAGAFLLTLKPGSDGNTIINECGVETVAGSARNFTTTDTVSASFSSTIRVGCVSDTIYYNHDGRNGVNSWKWSFDDGQVSSARDTLRIWQSTGQKQATLIVSNGTCTDTASAAVLLGSKVDAQFEATAVVCPGDPAIFKDHSTGPVFSRQWSFGNGNFSTDSVPPPQFYPSSNTTTDIPIRLIVRNIAGCADTTSRTIRVVGNCYIAIPKGFSPNSDGLNDFLYPTNAYKARELLFRVYNRTGQLLFETRDWMNKWDGSYKGNPQDPGTYVWVLQYTNVDTGKRFELKGSTVLIR
jgi:gliding motility-associated-like protein